MLVLRNMFQILHILCVCWLIRGWYASWSQSMHGIKKLFIVLIMYHEYWVVTDFFAFSAATYMVLCVENRIEVYTIDLHKKWFCKKGTSLIFFLKIKVFTLILKQSIVHPFCSFTNIHSLLLNSFFLQYYLTFQHS